ncbi:MAG TPA: GNAT family N-acetyltransferase, partial [Polyangiaceae bacterium]|nr:GNAT family N-acetyltransferase [Polyangiaceae bacterium]
ATRVAAKKERYYRLAADFFEFKEGRRTVGLFVCNAVDWSTYYIRSAAVLPEYQGLRLSHGFVAFLLETLRGLGVERVEADTSPSNFATLAILTGFHFNVTGTTLSDRWGAQLRLTRYLDTECEDVFLRQFCSGVIHQRRRRSGAAR